MKADEPGRAGHEEFHGTEADSGWRIADRSEGVCTHFCVNRALLVTPALARLAHNLAITSEPVVTCIRYLATRICWYGKSP
jgi:hypothetical protein